MKRLYYIEHKAYYIDTDGVEHQIADGGELPVIYSNQAKAIQRAEKKVSYYVENFGYRITISNDTNPARKGDCLYAVRIQKGEKNYRDEIRVYKIFTYD